MAIRQLRADEPIPSGAPRRYRSSHGYVRLRWRIGQNSYVEVYEHRIVAGRTAPCVHHRNSIKHDNHPSNLVTLTRSEHGQHHKHKTFDRGVARALYEQGLTTVQLAKEFDVTPGQISRALRNVGTKMRNSTDYKTMTLDRQRLQELFHQQYGVARIAREFGCSTFPVCRILKELGLSRPVGRIPRK